MIWEENVLVRIVLKMHTEPNACGVPSNTPHSTRGNTLINDKYSINKE
jgi:hypothetical protein